MSLSTARSIAGSVPGILTGMYRQWPAPWNALTRVLLTLGAAVLILALEFALAGKVFVMVYMLCGGYIPA